MVIFNVEYFFLPLPLLGEGRAWTDLAMLWGGENSKLLTTHVYKRHKKPLMGIKIYNNVAGKLGSGPRMNWDFLKVAVEEATSVV